MGPVGGIIDTFPRPRDETPKLLYFNILRHYSCPFGDARSKPAEMRFPMIISTGRRVAAMAAFLAVAGCSGNTLGSLEDVLGTVLGQPAGAAQGQVAVEIRGLNTQQQLLQVATQDGQTGSVRYDRNTVVVYRNQQYPVTALERGDLAIIHVQDVQGTPYVSRVDVQQSASERTGSSGLVQFSGRITQIDHNAGTFLLQTGSGTVAVALPYNAPQATVNYFHQLRVGHDVRVEATMLGTGRAEVYRFL
jgi:hypothetical protein